MMRSRGFEPAPGHNRADKDKRGAHETRNYASGAKPLRRGVHSHNLGKSYGVDLFASKDSPVLIRAQIAPGTAFFLPVE